MSLKCLCLFFSSVSGVVHGIWLLLQVVVFLAAVLMLCLFLRAHLIGPFYRKLHAEYRGNKEIMVLGTTAFMFLMLMVGSQHSSHYSWRIWHFLTLSSWLQATAACNAFWVESHFLFPSHWLCLTFQTRLHCKSGNTWSVYVSCVDSESVLMLPLIVCVSHRPVVLFSLIKGNMWNSVGLGCLECRVCFYWDCISYSDLMW